MWKKKKKKSVRKFSLKLKLKTVTSWLIYLYILIQCALLFHYRRTPLQETLKTLSLSLSLARPVWNARFDLPGKYLKSQLETLCLVAQKTESVKQNEIFWEFNSMLHLLFLVLKYWKIQLQYWAIRKNKKFDDSSFCIFLGI